MGIKGIRSRRRPLPAATGVSAPSRPRSGLLHESMSEKAGLGVLVAQEKGRSARSPALCRSLRPMSRSSLALSFAHPATPTWRFRG